MSNKYSNENIKIEAKKFNHKTDFFSKSHQYYKQAKSIGENISKGIKCSISINEIKRKMK